jgi:sugar porter (SP) family MFS transporter
MNKHAIYIMLIAFTAAIGGFLLGFDGSVISGAVPFYKSVFNLADGSFMLGFSVSCIIWGSILGNLIAGPLSDKIGRKPSLLIAALLFTATGLMCAFANSITVFIVGRIVGGLGVGIAILVAPVYIAEIAPAKKRGWLVSFNQLLIVIGLSAAYFSNYFILKNAHDPLTNWRWMLGVEIIPAVIYFVCVLFIPESPRWLVMHGKDAAAKKILARVEGDIYAENAYREIKQALLTENKVQLSAQLKELFTRRMKMVLVIGFGLAILQQFSGINAILYYAPMVFESAGGGRDAAFMQAIVLGVVFVIMTVVSMFLIDRLGRKPLLYMGVGLMALSLTVTGLLFKNASYQVSTEQLVAAVRTVHQESGATDKNTLAIKRLSTITGNSYSSELSFYKAIENALEESPADAALYKPLLLKDGIKIDALWVLLSILGFIAGFSISLGPVMWAILSEIFPNNLRGTAISVVGAVNALSSFLVATFFPIQLAKFGSSGTYFMYAAFMYCCLWFVWKYVVETKGKTLEQLEKELIK